MTVPCSCLGDLHTTGWQAAAAATLIGSLGVKSMPETWKHDVCMLYSNGHNVHAFHVEYYIETYLQIQNVYWYFNFTWFSSLFSIDIDIIYE